MRLPRTVALFWFTNFWSKIKASYFLQTLAWLNPILTKLHRCSAHRCVHRPWQVKWANLHCGYQSLFGLPLVPSNFLSSSLMFYRVGCGKWVAQIHTLKVVGIKLTPLQIKVTLLVQQKKTHLPMQETWGQFPEWWRSPGQGNGNSFQYSCQGNPMDRGAWLVTIHGVAKRIRHKLVTK